MSKLSRTRVMHYLREGIGNGTFLPNQRLVEADIAAHLGVSRTPVREALRELERLGLIRSTPNKGAEVAQIDAVELRAVNEVRKILESRAAQMATTLMTDQDFERLESLNLEMTEAARRREITGFIALNYTFHTFLYGVAGNDVLLEVIGSLWNRTTLFRHSIWYLPETLTVSITEHASIIDAMRRRDIDEVGSLVSNHIKIHSAFPFVEPLKELTERSVAAG